MSSKVTGCFEACCAASVIPQAGSQAYTRQLRRPMRFILFSPLELQMRRLCRLRIMSRFRHEAKSTIARPKPIGERERSGDGDDDEFPAVHARDQHRGE